MALRLQTNQSNQLFLTLPIVKNKGFQFQHKRINQRPIERESVKIYICNGFPFNAATKQKLELKPFCVLFFPWSQNIFLHFSPKKVKLELYFHRSNTFVANERFKIMCNFFPPSQSLNLI